MKKIFIIFSFFYAITFCVCDLSAHHISNKMFETISLYPVAKPYHEDYLPVSDIHSLYYAQFGNPRGVPVIVVHGGPGMGCSEKWTQFFDLSFYHVIMFDQRGAYRSKPFAQMKDNTPQLAVQDMERLRAHLGINKWIVFGGSYGSGLGILYGETHPSRILGFVLRGIFLARKQDYEHLFYGMRQTFPDAWQEMVDQLPTQERTNLLSALFHRVMNADPAIHLPAAHAFMKYDLICATLLSNAAMIKDIETNDAAALTTARAFIYYAAHNFFLEDNQLLNNISTIAHIPAIMVHGRYDTICPALTAFELHKEWQNSQLWYIPNAGHSANEPGIAQGLRKAMDEMKSLSNGDVK